MCRFGLPTTDNSNSDLHISLTCVPVTVQLMIITNLAYDDLCMITKQQMQQLHTACSHMTQHFCWLILNKQRWQQWTSSRDVAAVYFTEPGRPKDTNQLASWRVCIQPQSGAPATQPCFGACLV